jgi:hypothetical protein
VGKKHHRKNQRKGMRLKLIVHNTNYHNNLKQCARLIVKVFTMTQDSLLLLKAPLPSELFRDSVVKNLLGEIKPLGMDLLYFRY